jgi:hypothetical protein
MTQEDATVTLDELRALEAKATPGPWFRQVVLLHGPDQGGFDIGPLFGWHDFSEADAAFIVAAVQYVRDALIRDADTAVPDSRETPEPYCPCGGTCHHSASPCSLSCVAGERRERVDPDLRAALRDLLDDTQHAEHECGDADCPVARALAILAATEPPREPQPTWCREHAFDHCPEPGCAATATPRPR